MNDTAFLIPILDELYSRTHIPVLLLDDTGTPLYPAVSASLITDILGENKLSTIQQATLIIEDMKAAYALLPITIHKHPYILACATLLNNLDNNKEEHIPLKWRQFLSPSSIRNHISCEYLSSFQDFVKMLYSITTHNLLDDEDIVTLYHNEIEIGKEDDNLTIRRLVQTTPEYYHWEQKFFETFSNGNINEMKSLLSELHEYDIDNTDLNDLEGQKYKFAGFITILTRIAIQNGVSYELAFSLSDEYLRKLRSVHDDTRLALLLQEAIAQFHSLCQTYHNVYSLNINRCIHFIDTHLYDKLSLHTLADNIDINASYLSALFKKETGKTITAYIQQKKIEEAQRLLLFTNKSYSEIASLLNFTTQSNFIQIFKKYTKLTPKKFQMLKKKT